MVSPAMKYFCTKDKRTRSGRRDDGQRQLDGLLRQFDGRYRTVVLKQLLGERRELKMRTECIAGEQIFLRDEERRRVPIVPVAERDEEADGSERRLSSGNTILIKIWKSPAPSIFADRRLSPECCGDEGSWMRM